MNKTLRQLVVVCALACSAFGQLIQVQNQGSTIATWKKFGIINCSTNLVCTATGSTVNVVASVTASSAFSGITAATNSNAGSFVISGSTWDFSGAVALKWPVAAAFAPTADGSVGTNSTNHLPVFGSNGATLTYPATLSAASNLFLTGFNNQTGVFSTAQPTCGNLSNAAPSCATDATNASNITGGTLAAARLPNPSASSLGGIQSFAAVSNQWINTISTSGVPSSTQPACGNLSNAGGGCTMSTTAGGDLSGTLPSPTVANINGNSVPSGAAADQLLVGTAANTFSLKTLTNCTGGASAASYATSTHAFGCLASILTGTLTSARVPFANGTNSLTDSANLLYAAASGFTQIQGANAADAHYIKRFTDTSPTGNFLRFQDNAATTDLFKVDVLGNATATSWNTNNAAGNGGMLSLVQGTAPSAVANAVNFLAPTSVTTYTLTFPAAIGAGLFRTSSGGTMAFSELSGDATTSGSNAVTVAKVNGVSYGASPSNDTSPIITAANTATYTAINNCGDATHALSYNTSTHLYGCQAITATAAPAGSDTQVQYNNSAALGASAAFTFNKTDTLTIGVGGTTLGKLAMAGNTSGTTTVNAAAAASGTLTLPAATDTLVAKATTDTLTNKTLDAEGTGNVVTIPEKVWLPAAGCNNATASSFWDLPTSTPAVAACVTGTNTQKGVLQYADTTGGFSAQNELLLPADFSGNIDVRIIWRTSATSGNAKFSLSTICTDVAASATDDPAFNTASTVTTAAPGTTLRLQTSSISGVTATGCSAGNYLHVKLFRDGNDAADTLGASLDVIGVELTIRRAM